MSITEERLSKQFVLHINAILFARWMKWRGATDVVVEHRNWIGLGGDPWGVYWTEDRGMMK